MYSNPTLIRKNTVKLSLNDREAALVNALCDFTGEEKAALLRELIMSRVTELLGHDGESGASAGEMRRTNGVSFGG